MGSDDQMEKNQLMLCLKIWWLYCDYVGKYYRNTKVFRGDGASCQQHPVK